VTEVGEIEGSVVSMADELPGRAATWLQALWAQRAVDALTEAGALPAAAGDAQAPTRAKLPLAHAQALRTRLSRIDGGDALTAACEALVEVVAIAQLGAEHRDELGTVLGRTRLPVLVTDGERWCVEANVAAARLLGTSREEIAVHRLDDFVPVRVRRALCERWSALERSATASGALLLCAAHGQEVTAGYTAAFNLAGDRHLFVIESIDGMRFGPWAASPGARHGGPALRPREREVLSLVAAGCTSAGIALRLEVTRNTVESHIRNAVVRLGAANRTHAVVMALGLGLIALPAETVDGSAMRASSSP
jgi:DNA-binding CsgD family transcriptional regulator